MTFTGGIPQTGQSLGQTRDSIRNNFTNYNNLVAVDHVAPNSSNPAQGKHKKSTYPVQSPSPGTIAGEIALYSRSIASIPQLCAQAQSQTAGNPDVQMTRFDTGVSAAANGYTFLPGGLIMQWGSMAGANNNTTIAYPIAFTNNVYSITVSGGLTTGTQPTINYNPAALGTGSLTAFTLKISAGPVTVSWIAIGN